MGGAACFQLPTAPLSTRDGAPSALGCGPIVPNPAPAAVTISGNTGAYGSNTPLAGAEVALYGAADFATPLAMATSAADATYSLQLPMGSPDLMWTRTAAAGYLTNFFHGFRPDLAHGDLMNFNVRMLLPSNVEGAAILVKESWDPAFDVVVGTALDCNRLVIEHAAAVLSTASGRREFVPGASLYYGAPGAIPLAAPPDQRGDTNDNGIFAVFRVPGGQPLFIQLWGFVDAAAHAQGEAGLTLIAEYALHAEANSVSQMNVWVNK